MIGPYQQLEASTQRTAIEQLFAEYWPAGIYRRDLLQVLVAVQQHFGWISSIAMRSIQTALRDSAISLGELQGIVSFYHFLQLSPAASWQIHLSSNITDLMAGQRGHWKTLTDYAAHWPERLQVRISSCTGLCDQGPAMLLNGYPIARLNPERVQQILQNVEANHPLQDWPSELFAVTTKIVKEGPVLQHQANPDAVLTQINSCGAERFLQELELSGLQGRGGAGFNTADKWRNCRAADGPEKYVVCNADEGEPGTFKDRVLLQHKLDNMILGMRICAEVVGAQRGFIYLRKEYLFLLPHIQSALQRFRQQGLISLGFNVDVHLGAGAYVCGEETALLESMEGKRGIPRIRPPFPTTYGYLGKPTVVNNVETFCNVTLIADHGAASFRQLGTDQSPGSKLHSVSGDCQHPGIVELPYGASIEELLQLVGAVDCQHVQVGGPSGRLLSRDAFSQPLDTAHVNSGGSFMVFDRSRKIPNLLANFMHFFARESCGFCTPCRAGTQLLADASRRLQSNATDDAELENIREICDTLKRASHCGLGKTAGDCGEQAIEKYSLHMAAKSLAASDVQGIAQQEDSAGLA